MSLGVAPSASASTSTEAQLTGLSGLCLVDGSAFLHRLQDPDIPDRHRIHGQRVCRQDDQVRQLAGLQHSFAGAS